MNTSMLRADRAPYLKVVVSSLLVATLVVALISIFGRSSAAPFMMQVVVKANSIVGHAGTLSILPELIARFR
jgi:hypothetical protein